jgi:long-chain acyl-CoA synthetase
MPTLGDLLDRSAQRHRHRACVIQGARRLTYGELADAADRYARGLFDLGIRPGDRVALWMANCADYFVAYYGNAKLGAVTVPINTLFKPDEAHHLLHDSGAGAIVADHAYRPVLAALGPRLPRLKVAVVRGGRTRARSPSFQALLAAGADALASRGSAGLRFKQQVSPRHPAAILYTSGTTGRPKGAVLSHRSITFDARACTRVLHLAPADRALCVLPMFHAFAQTVLMVLPLLVGASVVVVERFHPAAVLKAMAEAGVTFFAGVPSMYALFLDVPPPARPPLERLRFCVSGAAPLPPALFERFEREFGVPLLEGDGPTECGPVTCVNPPEGPRKPGTVGLPLPGVRIAIFDESNRPLPQGQVGEIVVRGPNVMMGYLDLPGETRQAMAGGWFHTGDLGTIDEDGYITIVDRKKEIVIVGGLNVYPREVEEVLTRHPAVAEAAVVGRPDPLRGEVPVAFVTLRPGRSLRHRDLLAFCRQHLADFKVPRSVQVRGDLPRSATGKILRRALTGGRPA